eukprot:c24533_g1_i1.p1 GENE.c24533_g1_i1~~c24533_g1_i1.p1  ORF type:complete len:136 (-),score=23.48 c24533_g1_i1:135-542(-)
MDYVICTCQNIPRSNPSLQPVQTVEIQATDREIVVQFFADFRRQLILIRPVSAISPSVVGENERILFKDSNIIVSELVSLRESSSAAIAANGDANAIAVSHAQKLCFAKALGCSLSIPLAFCYLVRKSGTDPMCS